MGDDTRLCPSPEVLGAFLEGTADPVTQRSVQRHLTDCPECVFVVGETNRYISSPEEDEEAEEDAPTSRAWWLAVAAAAVAVVCLLGAWYAASKHDPLQRLIQVSAGLSTRGIEGRLTGFPHRKYVARRSATAMDPTLRVEAERVRVTAGNDARDCHARGIAALLLGRADESIALIHRATQLDPENAKYWSDLAAAHLAVSGDTDQEHVAAALRASRHALAVDPAFPPARFNEALALQRQGDAGPAGKAWDRYVDVDPGSDWVPEAIARRDSSPF